MFYFRRFIICKKKIEDIHDINCDLFLNGINNYTLQIQKVKKEKVINQNDIHNDPLAKQFIELLIKDIIHSNPNLEFYKGLFVLTNKKKKLKQIMYVFIFIQDLPQVL